MCVRIGAFFAYDKPDGKEAKHFCSALLKSIIEWMVESGLFPFFSPFVAFFCKSFGFVDSWPGFVCRINTPTKQNQCLYTHVYTYNWYLHSFGLSNSNLSFQWNGIIFWMQAYIILRRFIIYHRTNPSKYKRTCEAQTIANDMKWYKSSMVYITMVERR